MDTAKTRAVTQLLSGPRAGSAHEVVKHLGAVQAQEYADAKWAVALRTNQLHEDDVEAQLTSGRILRTHVLRPTWHFVAAEDIRWLLALSGPRVQALSAARYRQLELDAPAFRKSHNAITRALEGRCLTRAELTAALLNAGIAKEPGNRIAHLLMHAELDGLICSGPRIGNKSTYALLEERVPACATIDRDEALERLTRTYFQTRGPATIQDYCWWSGLTVGDAKRGIDAAGSDLRSVEIAGKVHWLCESTSRTRSRSAFLLQRYDEFVVGYRDRGAVTQRVSAEDAAVPRDLLGVDYAYLDGQLVARWGATKTADGVSIVIDPLVNLEAAEERLLERAAKRYGDYLRLKSTSTLARLQSP